MPEVGTAQMTETNNINSLLGVSYGSMNKSLPATLPALEDI